MKRIIKGIIHLLGGITVEENGENQVNCHELGSYFTAFRIRQYMRSLNGRPPEEWHTTWSTASSGIWMPRRRTDSE